LHSGVRRIDGSSIHWDAIAVDGGWHQTETDFSSAQDNKLDRFNVDNADEEWIKAFHVAMVEE